MLGHAAQAATFENAGLAFVPYRDAVPFSRVAPRGPVDIFATFVDGGTGRDVEEALAQQGADVVVGDCFSTRGAALSVPQDAPVDEIRRALTTLLADESYARSAAEIGARLRATDGAARAADRIAALTSRERAASLPAL